VGRIFTNIRIGKRDRWTLFDSGAENTYVVKGVARGLKPRRLSKTWPARLGGRVHAIRQTCILDATVKGKQLETLAFVIDEIGCDPDGRPIVILFGKWSMKQWNVVLDMKREALDLSWSPKQFVEF